MSRADERARSQPRRHHAGAAGSPPRLAADGRILRLLASPLGAFVARPWLDHAALFALRRLFFPLSRLWAAAEAAGESLDVFLAEAPLPDGGTRARTAYALARLARLRAAHAAAAARWEAAAFGEGAAGTAALAAAENERRARSHDYMAGRRLLTALALDRDVPLARWQVPGPDAVAEIHGAHLRDPASAFAPPDPMPAVAVSARAPGPAGDEHWIRFASPSARLGDRVTARVYVPAGGGDPPTLILGHGVCVELESWRGAVDDSAALCELGVRVVRPEAPWHGRRRPRGRYGGEPFIATAPLGALDLFVAQVRELAVLVDWCRRTGGGPVALGGVSLGALVAQLAATRARDWPARLRPDALFLVTHCGRLEEAVFRGSLAGDLGMAPALAAAGWTPERLREWWPLLDPAGPPAVPPERIVTVLGRRDTVTPFADGCALVDGWRLPEENRFVWDIGHFSVPLGLLRDRRPLRRIADVLARLA